MIRYSLLCGNEHEFDAWFNNSASFDEQAASELVSCPHCGDTRVKKAIMSPRVGKASQPATPEAAEIRAHEVARKILLAMGADRERIEREFEYVGKRFAEDARSIHRGEAEDRGIYEEATDEELEELEDEGIDVFPIPSRTDRRDN